MLKKDNFGEPKTHYKLYKCGKNWAVMGITLVSLGIGTITMTQAAAADTKVTNNPASQHVTSISTDESKSHHTSSTVVLTDDKRSVSTLANQVTSASGVKQVVSASSQEANSAQRTSQATSTSNQATNSAQSVKQVISTSSQEANSVQSVKQVTSASNQETSSAQNTSRVTSPNSQRASSVKITSQATNASSQHTSSTKGVSQAGSTSSQKSSSVKSQAQSLTTTNKVARATSTNTKKNSAQTKVSYSTLLQQLRTSKALVSDKAALTHVDKDNFLEYFSLNGSATYDSKTGIVTITPNQNNQVGNFSLTSKIDMNKSFTLTGQVNLGSDPNGADGIGFAFHSGNTTDVGNAGGNLGIGGLQDAIGFKLDTWFNSYQAPSSNKNGSEISSTDSNGFGWNGDSASAPYGTFVKTSNQEISTTNGSKVQRWWAQDTGKSQALSKADIDGHFHDFVVNYDGATRTLTVSYTQASGKVLTWTTTVDSSYQAMAMIVSASTGAAKNLQQFKLTSFDFQEAATVNVKYVDTTGHQLAQGTVNYPDGANVNGRYTTEQLVIPNYKFVKMDDGSVTGTTSLDANGTLTNAGNNGTVIYVYAPAYKATVKTVNETINYVDESGHVLTNKYTANPIHILTVTNPVDGTTTTYYSTTTTSMELDATTGKPVDAGWILGNSQDFDAVTHPQIKGYTVTSTDAPNSDLQHVASQTITSDSSDLEFTVIYTKNDPTVTTESKTVNETIHYVYTDGTTAHDNYVAQPITFTRTVSTDAVTGEKTYGAWSVAQQFAAVDSPAIKGYTPDQGQIGTQTVTGDSSDLEFTVVYTKNDPTVTTESKTVNETIHYVYTDGTTAHDDYVAQPITFTRTVSTDAVTGEKTYGAWSVAQRFAAVDSPAIKGYTPDQDQISTQTVTGDSSDLEFTVVYKADSTPTKPVKPGQPTTPTKPVKPGQPTTPTKPVKPGQPTTPTKPVQPGQPMTPAKPVKPGQPTAPAKPDQSMASAKSVQTGQTTTTKFVGQRLPQTDETDQQHMTLSGLLLLAMSSLLGFLGMAKRQRKE
ncbi:MucBP domain-containing protein [Lactiplantibacillus sp. DA1]|uniref:lectin-like domain-containing protein n=1 Tax=Lactiplantibacillus sp. DA1 TaxID=3079857 RepID=UPI00292A676F|nr:MucBP domain-containing protein [Lactiplantibacillus sp. DA1]MDV0432184.1 MucBP domain-containing protein [Lactiplantibacillus sp. DA1]